MCGGFGKKTLKKWLKLMANFGLTVICVLWFGEWHGTNLGYRNMYDSVYVSRLKDMVDKNTSHKIDFACLTNQPEEMFRKDIRIVPLKHNWPAWWSKVEVFNPSIAVESRILFLDLDILVVGNLDDLIEYSSDFVILSHSSFALDRNRVIKRAWNKKGKELIPFYNSTCVAFDRGARSQIYEEFDTKMIDRFCGDQDWIGFCLGPDEVTFPFEWWRKLNHIDKKRKKLSRKDEKILSCHPIKNHLLKGHGYKRADEIWRGLV